MPNATPRPFFLHADVCHRALDARDARFDGVFFVGITSTSIYCRPVCPARVSYPDRRRFFESAAAAERGGFRPCLRCRPELAPGRAAMDAVSRLARAATHRIGAGALNGRGVADLATDLGVGERHLRRALEREIGVSPIELAQTHRLLLAKRLLVDTTLSVTRIAFASGFQSLRRFNAVFREQYRMCPTALRRSPRTATRSRDSRPSQGDIPTSLDFVRLTLAYRAPMAWGTLLDHLSREAIPGVDQVQGGRYARTVEIDGQIGVIVAEDAATAGRLTRRTPRTHLNVHVSTSLLPVLMPLLARLRQLFDLDAEPTLVDAHLEREGLGAFVRQLPGLRIPGAIDGFDVALRILLSAREESSANAVLMARVVSELGTPFDSGSPAFSFLSPSAERVAAAGVQRLTTLGVPAMQAHALVAVARAVQQGSITLEPGSDIAATREALMGIEGMTDQLATMIVMRALSWPDAFPVSDYELCRATACTSMDALLARAERWRPWRAYAALHLWWRGEGVRPLVEMPRESQTRGRRMPGPTRPARRPARARVSPP